MDSRKSVKIAAIVLLIVGNVFMLAFLGMLISYTVLLGTRIFEVTLVVLPAYIAFASYKVGSVLGLIHILTEPRRRKWILVVIKILIDIVFFLSAVLTVLESIFGIFFTFIIALFANDAVFLTTHWTLLGLGILVIVIAAAFYIASFCVWYCFLCAQKMDDQDDQENGDIKMEEIEMDSMDKKPPV